MQLMISLYKLYPNLPMFLWCPFHWFHLVHDYSVKQFYEAVEIEGGKRYHIIGSDSYLERMAVNNLPREAEYSFAKSPFSEEISKYFTVIGEHVITVKLDPAITSKISSLFSSINNEKDVDRSRIVDVFSSPVKASVTVELNKNKAKRLKRKFTSFFGVESS